MHEPHARLALFRGNVHCRRDPGVLGLTLTGRAAEPDGEELALAFAGTAPASLPDVIENALIERSGPGEFRIASAADGWTIAARSVHLHRDVSAAFYRAIPPRPAPLVRRFLLRAALTIASSRVGLMVVRTLRR